MNATTLAPRAVATNPFQGQLLGPDGLRVRFETVTPDLAEIYLGTTKKNRSRRPGKVKTYARDMVEGRWRFNGATLCFDASGSMTDGQHRCQACVDSGVPFLALIVEGLAAEAQDTMDNGLARTAGDQLFLRGQSNGKTLAAVIRVVARLNSGSRSFSAISDVSTPQILSIFELDPEGFTEAARVGSGLARALPVAASIMGGAYYACGQIDKADAETFFVQQLTEGVGLYHGYPALALKNRLSQGASGDAPRRPNGEPYRRMHPDDQIRYTLLAWNAFRERRALLKLQAPRGGWTGKNFPDPK